MPTIPTEWFYQELVRITGDRCRTYCALEFFRDRIKLSEKPHKGCRPFIEEVVCHLRRVALSEQKLAVLAKTVHPEMQLPATVVNYPEVTTKPPAGLKHLLEEFDAPL